MKKLTIIIAVATAALMASACKSQYDKLLEGADYELKYLKAFEYFDKKQYSKAAKLFESVAMVSQGTEREDTVIYYWGFSNYSDGDYLSAEANFTKYLENFPNSGFAERVKFYRIDCMYRSTYRYELDQAPTYKALVEINEYLIANPEGAKSDMCRKMSKNLEDRLDKKAYENARIYYVMEDYKAARVALKNILKEDADNIYREDILYYAAMSSYKYAQMSIPAKQKERYLVFMDDYLNFVGEYPDSPKRKELDALYKKVQK